MSVCHISIIINLRVLSGAKSDYKIEKVYNMFYHKCVQFGWRKIIKFGHIDMQEENFEKSKYMFITCKFHIYIWFHRNKKISTFRFKNLLKYTGRAMPSGKFFINSYVRSMVGGGVLRVEINQISKIPWFVFSILSALRRDIYSWNAGIYL